MAHLDNETATAPAVFSATAKRVPFGNAEVRLCSTWLWLTPCAQVWTAFKDIVGGTMGGMGLVFVGRERPYLASFSLSAMCTDPFDTMKVSRTRGVLSQAHSRCPGSPANAVAHQPDVQGPLRLRAENLGCAAQQLSYLTERCIVHCTGKEGLMGFYKGVYSPLAGQMFLNATQFFAWGQSVKFVCKCAATPLHCNVDRAWSAGNLTRLRAR